MDRAPDIMTTITEALGTERNNQRNERRNPGEDMVANPKGLPAQPTFGFFQASEIVLPVEFDSRGQNFGYHQQ